MPPLIRLPAHVNDDEVRVYWDKTIAADDLHVWGPRSVRRLVLGIFTEKRLDLASTDIGDRFDARQQGIVEDKPSYLDELVAAGYDPHTLVFSIRKTGTAAPVVDVPDDLRKRLEDAQTALLNISSLLDEAGEAKGVYILSEADRNALGAAASTAEIAVSSALDALNDPSAQA